jgi:RNA polymerase sigma-70 factor (ECF subfamily)
LRLLHAGRTGASLDAIYRRYCRYVAAVILRLGGRRSEVEDLVQDVFVEAARGIANLREEEAIRGWLATIAVRTVRRRLRLRRARRFFGLDSAADYDRLIDPAASPVDKLMVATIYRVLDEVPVGDRLAFSLHQIEGEKLEEVARLCGCSCASAKRRIARTRQRIEEKLSND